MKTRNKFLAFLLVLVMACGMFAVMANAEVSNPLTTTDAVDGLTISVDYATEKVYLRKNADDDYTVLCDSTNGYYPFSFSMIMSSRSLVNGRPTVTATSTSTDATLGFAWAYTDNTGTTESTTTTYGLATLPTDSDSTVVVTTSSNHTITFHCSVPCGGTSAANAEVYAFLPAPGQFTNEGVTTGGWGDIFNSNGTKKLNVATGVSEGFFGGYVVYKFNNPVANDPTNPYGADFIVYGNAFWANSEPGCIQVSANGTDWYDIAGSKYYDSTTIKNASITYTNPTSTDNNATAAASNLGTLANVTYSGTKNGVILKNNFHKHSWYPLNCNYFTARNSETTDLAKVSEFPFASVSGDTLTLSGVMLQNVATANTQDYAFGYCDVHANNTLGGSVAYNPYQTFTSSNDYATKTNGTSGGDPIDISWAVNNDGTPKKLDSIQYVRIYTGTAQMNGAFGEISTEVCGIAACTGTISGNTKTTAAPTSVVFKIKNDTSSINQTISGAAIPSNGGTTSRINAIRNMAGSTDMLTVTVNATSGSNVFVNDVKLTETSTYSGVFVGDVPTPVNGQYARVIIQNGNYNAYIFVIK